MNQLKEFGFSAQWWRGEKGEYWVMTQALLFLSFIFLPVYPVIKIDDLSPVWQGCRWGLIGVSGSFAVLLFLWGKTELGQNLTPL